MRMGGILNVSILLDEEFLHKEFLHFFWDNITLHPEILNFDTHILMGSFSLE